MEKPILPPASALPAAGRREFVALPEWGVARIRAKLDTGARTSAIHVSAIEELGGGRLRFELVTRAVGPRRTRWIESTCVRVARVRPSSGELQERPVVITKMCLGPIESPIEVSLVCRQGMLCRMLLGRRALAGLVVVDPARKYLFLDRRGHEARR